MKKTEIQVELLQPWSTFVMKTQLPPEILQKMLKITDEIVANVETAESLGKDLAGQIKDELAIALEILEREDVMMFFLDVIRQFVIQQTLQANPYDADKEKILNDEYYTHMLSMWIISQKDNEYNPVHMHRNCHVSTVMYLKIPEFLPTRKLHKSFDDGAICFINNTSHYSPVTGDHPQLWSVPAVTLRPQVGDFFIFPSSQLHQVYPFRTADGKGERRSVSFNASFTSKNEQDALRKQQEEQEPI